MKKFSTIVNPLCFFFIIILSMIMFSLSTFVYMTKPNRLEPKILYYYGYSTLTRNEFLPEVRNIPRSKISIVGLRGAIYDVFYRLTNRVDLENFVSELMYGPQNINARQLASKYYSFDKVIYGDKGEVFIKLLKKPSQSQGVTRVHKEDIVQWLEYNIKKNYDITKLNVLFF